MENKEIKQYLINFVEKTLNECEVFKKVYGVDFVRKKLETNLEKVYINISNCDSNTALYDMENSSITIFSNKPLDILDIENNKKLKHLILHESIHAIFRRTREECKKIGIEDGTGVLEFHNNNQEIGRGFNEGLTEWICQKAGYGQQAYMAEKNIIRILELAIGEDAVMQLANGDIKGNVAQLLKMSKVECLQMIALVDNVYQNEEKTSMETHTILDNKSREELDKNISHLETILFEKYFKDDIELAQKTENISEEIMQHLYDLVFCINGGETIASKDFTSRLALKFKNQIYPEILKRYQKEIVEQIKNSRQAKNEDEKIDLPVPYKKSWFQRLKEAIKSKFIKKSNQDIRHNGIPSQEKSTKQQFKRYICDMSNYSEEKPAIKYSNTNIEKSKLKSELETHNGQEL